MKLTTSLVVILAVMCSLSLATKVLLLPMNHNSHLVYMGRLAAALSEAGDQVTIISASNAKVPDFITNAGMKIIKYKVTDPVPFANSEDASKGMIAAALSNSVFGRLRHLLYVFSRVMDKVQEDCVHLFNDTELLEQVKAGQYDIVVTDPSSMCSYYYPYYLDLPWVSLSVPLDPVSLYRVPALPSFIPSVLTAHTDHMTFLERVKNTALSVFTELVYNNSAAFGDLYVPAKPSRAPRQMFHMSKLWLTLRDESFGYPAPQMPNTMNIGDIFRQKAERLPEGLHEVISDAKHGAVVVSFGSVLDNLPEEILGKFCSVFSSLDQLVIWKTEYNCDHKGNMKLMNWLPQNDILAHKNVRLLITHGGVSSILEAVSHGVPMLVLPAGLDQTHNAAIVTSKGYGLSLAFAHFSKMQLKEAILEIIKSPSMSKNVLAGAMLMSDKLQSPGKRISHAIKHVLKYGDNHLRSGAYHLNTFQFLLFDIYLFLAVISLLLLVLAITASITCMKCARHGCCRRKKDKLP